MYIFITKIPIFNRENYNLCFKFVDGTMVASKMIQELVLKIQPFTFNKKITWYQIKFEL